MLKKFFEKLPPMPWRYDRRRKIKNQKTVDKIIHLRESGWTLEKLAKKYHVTTATILRYVDEDFAERSKERSREYSAMLYWVDPNAVNERATESLEYKLSILPKIKKHYASGLPQNA